MFAKRISRQIAPLIVTCVAVIGSATSAASSQDGHTITRERTAEIADGGVSRSTSAETTDGLLILTQTQGMNRRGDRRDTRQDCRHQEGAVGADKRNCKQQRRQTRGSHPSG
jgi:hypothetical protein